MILCDTDEFTVDASWLSTKPALDNRLKLSSSLVAHEKAIVEDALRARAESEGGNKAKGEADMVAATALIEKLRHAN